MDLLTATLIVLVILTPISPIALGLINDRVDSKAASLLMCGAGLIAIAFLTVLVAIHR